ncbi:uncharacterized protein [Drosophila virilis]|uniref:Class I SAM-dependent methyltransferase n=1 Tax=Drosophila virilis TaxID=7244 RepID=A0A0Q9W1E7_DROVI|nr:uncharacterized protein LOC26530677 [Drosophila virilis]KRF78662.1 uncharacterized protein Dvir_GJ25907 [Drosophila virilis]
MPRVWAPHDEQKYNIIQAVFNMWNDRTELEALCAIYCLTEAADAKPNWRKLLELGNTLERELKRKLLWVWPTALDLKNFNQILNELAIRNVLSIGCGSGLLEWLVGAVADQGLRIYGLERDPNWWRSKYAVRSFIPLNYIEEARSKLTAHFLSDCCSGVAPCALLFCYFNNRSAFLEYLSVFEGKWLILIGPQPAVGIHTEPNPLQPQIPGDQWALHQVINWTEQNLVAVYEKLS